MNEQPAVTIFSLPIPTDAMPMIEAAAKQYGWQPTIMGADGQQATNPQSAIQAILYHSIMLIKSNAINQLAQERANAERVRAENEMAEKANLWLAALAGG